MSTVKRIKQYIDFKGIGNSLFEQSVGMSNGAFATQLKREGSIGTDKLENILKMYSDLNPEWVILGKGGMILRSESISNVLEDENEIVNYLIMNSERLLDNNRNFKVWYDNLVAKAKHDFMKELIKGNSLSIDLEKSSKENK